MNTQTAKPKQQAAQSREVVVWRGNKDELIRVWRHGSAQWRLRSWPPEQYIRPVPFSEL